MEVPTTSAREAGRSIQEVFGKNIFRSLMSCPFNVKKLLILKILILLFAWNIKKYYRAPLLYLHLLRICSFSILPNTIVGNTIQDKATHPHTKLHPARKDV